MEIIDTKGGVRGVEFPVGVKKLPKMLSEPLWSDKLQRQDEMIQDVSKGTWVTVRDGFEHVSTKGVKSTLEEGMQGVVQEVDKDGDVLVDFGGKQLQWVYKTELGNLVVIENHEAFQKYEGYVAPTLDATQVYSPTHQQSNGERLSDLRNADDFDYLFKLVLVGDSGVGKSCLLIRFTDNNFSTSLISTIGVDFRYRTMSIGGKLVKLQIWDTAGQEAFRALTHTYYRQADGILMVYDATNRKSFANIRGWWDDVEKYASQSPSPVTILVGNKADVHEERQVPARTADLLAMELGLPFVETSAKTAENVHTTFAFVAQELMKTRDEGHGKMKEVKLDKDDQDDSSCCF
jgi:Ras-related protein Rab-1A